MAGDFYKLAEVAVDYKLDIIQGVPTEVAQKQATHKEQMEYLKLTLDQVLVSSYVSEADQTDLKYLINNALDLVNGVINPGTPTVGTTLPADTGDTIA